jgi:hypothetical protein
VTDWLAWHAEYETPQSALSQRLSVVQELLAEAVVSHKDQHLRVLSICAGDGRDVLPVLARTGSRRKISGRLIELEPELAERARRELIRAGLRGLEVVCGDAARPANYSGAIPTELVLVCGVFGNVSDRDVRQIIDALPAMCALDANVVWTRHRRDPDLTPTIREWFTAAGFEERAFHSPGPGHFSVGRHQLVVSPRERRLRDPLFKFTR